MRVKIEVDFDVNVCVGTATILPELGISETKLLMAKTVPLIGNKLSVIKPKRKTITSHIGILGKGKQDSKESRRRLTGGNQ